MERICIVALNWNKKNLLKNLLISLNDSLTKKLLNTYCISLIVVDNASTDDSVTMLKSEFQNIILLQNSENLGGSGGYNTGIRYALDNNFDYVWLLDNDAYVCPNALDPLLEAINSSENIAIAGSTVLHYDDPTIISEIGALINPITSFPMPICENWPLDLVKENIFQVDYVAICSALIRTSAIRLHGILEEHFFLMWDDMEWGFRFKQTGYNVVASSKSRVIHPGFSERDINPGFIYYASRNHLYFIYKRYSGIHRILLLLHITSILLYKAEKSKKLNLSGDVNAFKYAIADFWKKTDGKSHHNFQDITRSNPVSIHLKKHNNIKILLSASWPVGKIKLLIKELQQENNILDIFIVVNHNRIELFRWIPHNRLIIIKNIYSKLRLIHFYLTLKPDFILIKNNEKLKPLFFINNSYVLVLDNNFNITHKEKCLFTKGIIMFFYNIFYITICRIKSLYISIKYLIKNYF